MKNLIILLVMIFVSCVPTDTGEISKGDGVISLNPNDVDFPLGAVFYKRIGKCYWIIHYLDSYFISSRTKDGYWVIGSEILSTQANKAKEWKSQ